MLTTDRSALYYLIKRVEYMQAARLLRQDPAMPRDLIKAAVDMARDAHRAYRRFSTLIPR